MLLFNAATINFLKLLNNEIPTKKITFAVKAVAYADDVVVCCQKGKAKEVLEACTIYLKDELGLDIKKSKCLSTDSSLTNLPHIND